MRNIVEQQRLFREVQIALGHSLGLTIDGMREQHQYVRDTLNAFIDAVLSNGVTNYIYETSSSMFLDYVTHVLCCRELPELRKFVIDLSNDNEQLRLQTLALSAEKKVCTL